MHDINFLLEKLLNFRTLARIWRDVGGNSLERTVTNDVRFNHPHSLPDGEKGYCCDKFCNREMRQECELADDVTPATECDRMMKWRWFP